MRSILFAIVLALAANTAQAAPPAGHASKQREIQVTQADKGKMVTAFVGSTIVLRLPGNRESGYAWKIVSQTGDSIKAAGDAKYFPGLSGEGKSNIGGSYVFRFKGEKTGKTALKLQYVKPGDKEKHPNTFLCTVFVKSEP